MKLLEKIVYAQVLMMVMVIWVVPMSYGSYGDDVPMPGDESDRTVTEDLPDPPTSYGDGTRPPTSNGDEANALVPGDGANVHVPGDGANVPVPGVETSPPKSNGDKADAPMPGDGANMPAPGVETSPPTSNGDKADAPVPGDGANVTVPGVETSPPTSNGDKADAPVPGDGANVPVPGDGVNVHVPGVETSPPTSNGDKADAPVPGDGANPPNGGDGTDALESGWHDARATFYGDINGGETQQGACGYGDLHKQGYGLATAALSTALFNNGYTCGACYEIKCVSAPQWCLPGTIKITATNFCPPDFSKTQDCWCNPPQKHFDLSQPMFLKIAKYKAGVVPVRYRRVPCAKTGGVKFEIKGNPHFLMILPYNVGGAGDIKAMHVKGTKTEWITMKKNWGQIWTTGVVLTGQCLSFRITTSDGVTKDFMDVTPPTWGCTGQSFDGKVNF